VGGQQFPVHWGGDCESTYTAMAESLRAGLSLGLGGFGFWSHDIGGFEGTPSAGLFKRWVAFGLLSSHSRLHGSDSYRVPWAFDDDAVEVTREFAHLKNALMPYLWGAAVQAHEHGIPVMRAMLLEFPEDRNASFLDRQYMLGPDLLVAPVFSDEGDVDVYVPAGTWTSYLDGTGVTGAGWVRQRHGFHSLPLLVRPGAVIPVGPRTDRPDYDDALAPTFEVFGMVDGDQRVACLYDAAGGEYVRVQVTRTGEELRAVVVRGLEHLVQGWTLRWVTGPLDGNRGPSVTGTSQDAQVSVRVQ
jgi:alpha-D-xyloside xylohydrolase